MQRLAAPGQRVTMPNVVGMTKADAVRTMNALDLVARVIYEDNSSEAEGICFLQDTNGALWNTDASIFIWVQQHENRGDGSGKDETERLPEKT